MFRQGKHCTPILNHDNNFLGCYKYDSVTVPKMSECGFFSRPCFPLFGLNTGNYEPEKIGYSLPSAPYIIANIKLFLALQKIAVNTAAFFFFSFSVVIGKSYYFGFQDEKSVLLYMLNQNSSLLLLKSHYKSSRPQLFYKMSVLKKFAKFTGKYLCLRLFFKKYAGWRPTTLTEIHPSRGVFLGISQNLQEYSFMERLLLL